MTSKPHSVFSDPETQALHDRNLEWLRLMSEEPGWVLSRLHRLAELEEQLEVMTAQRNILHMAASSVYAALYQEEYARARRQLEDALEATSFPASKSEPRVHEKVGGRDSGSERSADGRALGSEVSSPAKGPE